MKVNIRHLFSRPEALVLSEKGTNQTPAGSEENSIDLMNVETGLNSK